MSKMRHTPLGASDEYCVHSADRMDTAGIYPPILLPADEIFPNVVYERNAVITMDISHFWSAFFVAEHNAHAPARSARYSNSGSIYEAIK